MALALILYLVLGALRFLTLLISMLISRQCEYRADAVAVKLCRDPLSLAQALRRISRGWRGGGDVYSSMESLFIISPDYNHLDETKGPAADLFSTHPPVMERMRILLGMARSDLKALDSLITTPDVVRPTEVKLVKSPEFKWFAALGGQWQGPFTALELAGRGVDSDTFVRRDGAQKMTMVSTDPALAEAIKRFSSGGRAMSALL